MNQLTADGQPIWNKQKTSVSKAIKVQRQYTIPLLHADFYLSVKDARSITPTEKKDFLEFYYNSGNMGAAAKKVGRDLSGLRLALTKDKAFAQDFEVIKTSMKSNLEETMYQNGLQDRGYMDRITWLRRHFPQEYNPNYVDKSSNPTDAIKELSDKLGEYELIPKNKLIETKDESDSDSSTS
jgi:hypothetical protein